MKNTLSTALLLTTMCVLSATTAHAQALKSIRLRVDPTLFEYVKQNGGFDEPGSRASTQAFGLLPSLLWVGVGVSPNNHINVGVNTMLGTHAAKAFGGESSDSAILLVPYAEYVSNGDELRGFLSVHAGLGGLFSADAPVGVSGALGASVGVRYFMDQHVSFDPHLRLLYTAMPMASETVKTFSVGIVFGVSFWLGSSKAAPLPGQRSHMRRSARAHRRVHARRPSHQDAAPDNAAPAPQPTDAPPIVAAPPEPYTPPVVATPPTPPEPTVEQAPVQPTSTPDAPTAPTAPANPDAAVAH